MLSGSVAMGVNIILRAKRDFNFVVYMRQSQALNFVEKFKEGYCCDESAIKDAIQSKSVFNIIDMILNIRQISFYSKKMTMVLKPLTTKKKLNILAKPFF